jgi:hypothetical protein
MTAALLGQHFAQRYGSSAPTGTSSTRASFASVRAVPTRLPVSICVT